MPYIPTRESPNAPMERMLKSYGYNGAKLGELMGWSKPTGVDRMKNPGKINIDDLRVLYRRGHVPIEELMESLQKAITAGYAQKR